MTEQVPDDHQLSRAARPPRVHDLPVDPDVEPQDRVEPLRFSHLVRPLRRLLVERWDVLLVISLGGVLGSLARWGTSVAWPSEPGGVPWATLQVNVLGAGLIGLLMVLVRARGPEGRYLRPFLGVGVLGGYTTFSTYALDVHQLLVDQRAALAASYLVLTVVLGLLAVWCGVGVGTFVVQRARRDVEVSA